MISMKLFRSVPQLHGMENDTVRLRYVLMKQAIQIGLNFLELMVGIHDNSSNHKEGLIPRVGSPRLV